MTAAPSISLHFQEHDGRSALSVAGRLDLQTVPEAWDRLSAATPPTLHLREVVVDVSGVTYCDGAGLGLFAELRRRVSIAGGHVQFTGSSPELPAIAGHVEAGGPRGGATAGGPAPGYRC